MLTKSEISKIAQGQDLIFLGVAPLNLKEDYARYSKWVEAGMHAGMQYMAKNLTLRADPKELMPTAKNSLVFAKSYGQKDKLSELRSSAAPWIAQYARFKDYHKVLRRKLEVIAEGMRGQSGCDFSFRICVDSAPILERALASKTEKGFIGKNSLYIHPRFGSFLLLAEVLTDLDLPIDQNQIGKMTLARSTDIGGCGSCKRCQVNCPTDALSTEYVVDARKCISYWTIEHRGIIPLHMWRHLSEYVFGCDICQMVCPYNRKPQQSSDTLSVDREVDLHFLVSMNEQDYLAKFAGTPVIRAKREGLRRNALIALAIKKDPRLRGIIAELSQDSSEVIRGTCQQIAENYL